jgi:hypothetical protein
MEGHILPGGDSAIVTVFTSASFDLSIHQVPTFYQEDCPVNECTLGDSVLHENSTTKSSLSNALLSILSEAGKVPFR